jgi:hypothetical protein
MNMDGGQEDRHQPHMSPRVRVLPAFALAILHLVAGDRSTHDLAQQASCKHLHGYDLRSWHKATQILERGCDLHPERK